ncbi:pentapeptide repeat-containing protein [Palleronia caenipelagi]|uniref:Pentapeptide repeat-containing protein n=1 Tax=Palleronia caenipelagi TaxID=2489174 RepID=A0A547Q331_9RHOB|nr:pentapeptide repeat-containing protein [Palleronia caenipelagi]TRD20794.1 pentapeptide repeat-containing protein [Palleronia caenipelagi]
MIDLKQRSLRVGSWLPRHYWKFMIAAGLAAAAGAVFFYLAEIAIAVNDIVDLLQLEAGKEEPAAENIRNLATGAAVLLAALAAATTLVFQLVKVWTTERQTRTAEEGHITDRINKAVENLGADKVVKTADGEETVPNLEVRLGAIYALERISRDSLRDHVQIMEIFCAYVRNNAPAGDAAYWGHRPELLDIPKPRVDIQTILTVIGRREKNARSKEIEAKYRPDLSGCSLQGLQLANADLSNINFDGTRMDNAVLDDVDMSDCSLIAVKLTSLSTRSMIYFRNANLLGASLISAYVPDSDFTGANLSQCKLQNATFGRSNLTNAKLMRVVTEDDAPTILTSANLKGAGLRLIDLRGNDGRTFSQAFGDSTVKLPDGCRAGQGELAHWSAESLPDDDFENRWRAWQREMGYLTD